MKVKISGKIYKVVASAFGGYWVLISNNGRYFIPAEMCEVIKELNMDRVRELTKDCTTNDIVIGICSMIHCEKCPFFTDEVGECQSKLHEYLYNK